MFVNSKEIHKFEVKDSEFNPYEMCLGNILKDWSVDNMKNTGLKDCIYDFSNNFDVIWVSDILEIHKFLMKKNEIIVNV